MQQTHFSRSSAHSQGAFGWHAALERFLCTIMLVGMLLMAALPTVAAYAQDVQTQTPTATVTTAEPTGAPTQAPSATSEATGTVADTPSATPLETQTSAPLQTQTPAQAQSVPSATANATPLATATAGLAKMLLNTVCQSGEKTASFKLDGVSLSVCAPSLPGDFITPDPSSSDQIATAATLNPYQEFSITAVPYGLKVSTESLPAAAAGLAGQYLQDLKDARIAQSGQVKAGPDASIFGSSASSIASLVSLKIHGDSPSRVVIVEWVAEAGKRLWIIRYSQEVSSNVTQTNDSIFNAAIQPLANVIVSSQDISGASTSAKYFAAPNPPPPGAGVIAQAAGDLPFPSWWSGDCDKNNFPGSYALGGIYKGVKACGPINTQRVVRFAPGLWGELEWQCVELSMRFMYLAYGILPYPGNGNQVVSNYSPKPTDLVHLVKKYNDTPGVYPLPGDVLSYGIDTTYGHTSVVSGSSVDSNGNGTVNVIEQNVSSPSNGMETLTVKNWHVYAFYSVYGWLTPGNNPAPTLNSISSSPSSTITSAMAGTQGLAVIAYGANFMGSSVIRWNGASLVTAFVNSGELIAAVPNNYIATGSTAKVTIHTPGPGGGTSSAMTFTINNPVPALTGLSSSTALIGSSGFTLTANGSNFVSASQVLWNGAALSTTFVSATQLTASVPSSDLAKAGAVNITVFNPAPAGGPSAGVQTFTVNYRVPTLTSISPSSALADSNTVTLTVKGTNFVPVSVVRWNGANLATTYSSSTKLTAVIPAADLIQAANIPITVYNPSPGGGASSAMTFTVNNPLPTITSLAPDHQTAGTGSFSLTVTGKNFVPNSTVRWNGLDLTTSYVSPTQLTAQVTAQLAANPGWMNITVFNPTPAGGTTGTLIFKVVSQTPGACVAAKSISLGGSDSNNNSVSGSTNNIDTYPIVNWDMHGPEYTYQFTTAQPATVTVDLWDITVALKVILIDGGSGSCQAANGLAYGTRFVFNALANHPYYFVIDGHHGAIGGYRITVDAFAPINGATLQTARPIFQWPAIAGAKSYTLQVSTSSSFDSLLLNTSTSHTSYSVGTAFPSKRQLYWRVKTNSGSYIYMPNGYLSFKTGNPPGTPKLSSPASNGLVTSYTNLLLEWSNSSLPSGVTLSKYQLQVSVADPGFASTLIDTTTSQSNYLMSSLSPNTLYYWRVQAFGSNGSFSNWSSVKYFRAAILPTSLSAPANGATVTTTLPSFQWNAVSGASSYTLQVSSSSSFSSLTLNQTVSGTSYTATSALPAHSKLFWRVQVNASNGPSLWTATSSFTTP